MTSLTSGTIYSTSAQTIYDEACRDLGWDTTKRKLFGTMTDLYAEIKAHGKEFGVWFISKSNWNGKDTPLWKNIIDIPLVHQITTNIDHAFVGKRHIRVIFALDKKGNYQFIGVYKRKLINLDEMKETFELISDTYPTI